MGGDEDHKIGHNSASGAPMEWVRWTKKRTFVRALEGTYGDLAKDLYSQPRVYSTKSIEWHGGPAFFHKAMVNPQQNKIAQQIECHVDAYAPGAFGAKHGHMNSAVFFVLKGHGYDIHDGRKIPWEAGDALIVENACVHQHFNGDDENDCLVVVMKAKPLFLFMHMLFQKNVTAPPSQAMTPAQALYEPPPEL